VFTCTQFGDNYIDTVLFCRAILSCAVLHNICQQRRLPVLDLLQEEEAGNDEPPYNGREEGLRYRDWVADTFF